jgi:hypothetical protein
VALCVLSRSTVLLGLVMPDQRTVDRPPRFLSRPDGLLPLLSLLSPGHARLDLLVVPL